MKSFNLRSLLLFNSALIILSCNGKNQDTSDVKIKSIELKTGNPILCGPSESQFGAVDFLVTASSKIKKDFNLATAMLHSFEYDEAEKMFAKVIEEEPKCAMAYWGVAMSNYHPLWSPPNEAELKKGSKAIEIARSIDQKSKRESEYVEAIGEFYKDWEKADHRTRSLNYEKAMERIHTNYPEDKEAAIFYALALNSTALPTDKTFTNQKKAVAILNKFKQEGSDHPGIEHYIIHNYDNPELAELALPSARRYASVAPSSAHAQHMPSHIFIRLGLWDESIKSNLASISSAKCYAETAGIKGHWDEELHGLDYLVYAYLQKGDNQLAKEQWDYLKTIKVVYPVNFKSAYSFSAIPARYILENRIWKEAAELKSSPSDFEWDKYLWENAITHFTRLLGYVHTNNITKAKKELQELEKNQQALLAKKDDYKANQVDIQVNAGRAWIFLIEKNTEKAIEFMTKAADMEDATSKHPVTPGEVLPARELLGDMYMKLNNPSKALEAYEADLKKHPLRFNAIYGAALASEKSGDLQKAHTYYKQLVEMAGSSKRSELKDAKLFLQKHQTTS